MRLARNVPVAVMAESAFIFIKLLAQYKNQEFKVAIPTMYNQVLVLYLLHNDMNNACYFWKIITPAINSTDSELGGI